MYIPIWGVILALLILPAFGYLFADITRGKRLRKRYRAEIMRSFMEPEALNGLAKAVVEALRKRIGEKR